MNLITDSNSPVTGRPEPLPPTGGSFVRDSVTGELHRAGGTSQIANRADTEPADPAEQLAAAAADTAAAAAPTSQE